MFEFDETDYETLADLVSTQITTLYNSYSEEQIKDDAELREEFIRLNRVVSKLAARLGRVSLTTEQLYFEARRFYGINFISKEFML